MIKFTVPAGTTRTITAKTGKQFHLQTVYAHTFERDGKPSLFPVKTDIFLDNDQHGNPKVYPAGDYQLHPSALYVDDKGRLAVAPRLAPLPKA